MTNNKNKTTNIPGTYNLKNYIQILENQGKSLLLNGSTQLIASLRANGIIFEDTFKKEFIGTLDEIRKVLNGKSADFSMYVLSAMILMILEIDENKKDKFMNNKNFGKDDMTDQLLGYI